MRKSGKIAEGLPAEVESFVGHISELHNDAYRKHIRMLRSLWNMTRKQTYNVEFTRPEILSVVTSLNRKRRGLVDRHERLYAKAILRARGSSGEGLVEKSDAVHVNGFENGAENRQD